MNYYSAIARMERGSKLRLTLISNQKVWTVDGGVEPISTVSDVVAEALISTINVKVDSPGLTPEALPQAWRYEEPPR